MTKTDTYDGDGVTVTTSGGVPVAPSSSLRRAETTYAYDEQQRLYRTTVYPVDPSSGAVGSGGLASNTYRGPRGNVIATAPAAGPVTKSVINGAGWTTTAYTTDNAGGDPASVAADHVLSQMSWTYDNDGNVIKTADAERDDDYTSAGALASNTTDHQDRVSYTGDWYDAAGRPTATEDVGTDGGTAWSRPSSPDTRDGTHLVTSTTYGAAGWPETVTDPRNIVAKTAYDMLGRTTETIAAYTGASPSASADQTTTYTYDGDNNLTSRTAVMPTGTASQTTAYVYGVTVSGGSAINSNDLLAKVEYPDKTTGSASASASDDVSSTYNRLGEMLTKTDQNGTTHTYSRDVLGRLTLDNVTTLGSGVDGAVRALGMTYNSAGLPETFTSYGQSLTPTSITHSGTTATATVTGHGYSNGDTDTITGASPAAYDGTFVISGVTTNTFQYTMATTPASNATAVGTVRKVPNQVKRLYNGLGQLTDEYQAHGGAVTSSTPDVRYAYDPLKGRPTGLTYPDGRGILYHYSSGIDDRISRLSYIADDTGGGTPGTHLEEYSYLGLSTIVRRNRPEPGTQLTYANLTGESSGEAGDQYGGLDRFGRVIDQRWLKLGTPTPTATDRTQQGYDADSNVLYKLNAVNGDFSELYHANSSATGDDATAYDKLNRLTGFGRGDLSASGHNGSTPDTVSTFETSLPGYSRAWDYDAVGNMASVTTDGTSVSRTHDARNELTSTSDYTSGGAAFGFDDDGSLTSETQSSCSYSSDYWYDAWDRMVADEPAGTCDCSYTCYPTCSSTYSHTSSYYTYDYDALSRRIASHGTAGADLTYWSDDGAGHVYDYRSDQSTHTDHDLLYSADGQVLQDHTAFSCNYDYSCDSCWTTWDVDPDTCCCTSSTCTCSISGSGCCAYSTDDQYVWGNGYVNDLVLRDRRTTGTVSADAGFGTGGKVTTDFSSRTDAAHAVAQQPDGKVIVAGSSAGGGTTKFALARYNADGTLDTTFGTGGKVLGPSLSGTTEGWTVAALESGGKILVGGYTTTGSAGAADWVLARYNADGSADTSFGTSGVVTIDLSGGDDYLRGLVVQGDGKIVAVGDIDDGTGVRVMAVARFNADGSADTSFGTSGVKTISFVFVSGADAHGCNLALQPDGKVVVAGDTWVDSTNQTDLAVARLNPDGSLDTSFGTAGKTTTDWGHGADHAYAVAVGPDGTVVVAGTARASGADYFSVTRYTPAGALDTSFGPDGHVTAFASSSEALAVRVDGLGRVTAAGTSGGNFALLRLNADGSADGSFGTSGQITTDFGTSGDTAYAAAFIPAGDVLAAGTESGTGGGDFAVARYAAGSGTLDQRLYAQQEANYNVTSLTDAAGTVVQRFVYDPYGTETVLGSGWGTTADAYDWHVGFQGMWLDTATGLYHTPFRDYSPTLGRWMQQDPAGYAGGNNLYQSFGGRPSDRVDPSGLLDRGGHWYTTFTVAMLRGMSPKQAEELAYWSQYPDENPIYDATRVATPVSGGWRGANWMGLVHDYLHALCGNPVRRRGLYMCLLKRTDLKTWQRGFLIHALGDSHVHRLIDIFGHVRGFSIPVIGHAPVGHTVDWIGTDPGAWQAHVHDLFETMGGTHPRDLDGLFAVTPLDQVGLLSNNDVPRKEVEALRGYAQSLVDNYYRAHPNEPRFDRPTDAGEAWDWPGWKEKPYYTLDGRHPPPKPEEVEEFLKWIEECDGKWKDSWDEDQKVGTCPDIKPP